MKLYAGINLHSNNSFISIIDEIGKQIYRKRVQNDLMIIINELTLFIDQIEGIALESTYNWYWLVDGLRWWVRLALLHFNSATMQA